MSDDAEFVNSYKLKDEQLVAFFADVRGYKAFCRVLEFKTAVAAKVTSF